MPSSGRLESLTAADGDVNSSSQPRERWEVALPYAGARRDYVEQVADSLKELGLRCFYDADHEVQLARWHDAKTGDPYAWAVLTAAVDVARPGARAPLTSDLLTTVIGLVLYLLPGFCS